VKSERSRPSDRVSIPLIAGANVGVSWLRTSRREAECSLAPRKHESIRIYDELSTPAALCLLARQNWQKKQTSHRVSNTVLRARRSEYGPGPAAAPDEINMSFLV